MVLFRLHAHSRFEFESESYFAIAPPETPMSLKSSP